MTASKAAGALGMTTCGVTTVIDRPNRRATPAASATATYRRRVILEATELAAARRQVDQR